MPWRRPNPDLQNDPRYLTPEFNALKQDVTDELGGHIGQGGEAHQLATQELAGFQSPADKKKLDGVAEGANNYTHPETHPPGIIELDPNNRFVTDAEKAAWNRAKQDAIDWAKGFGLGSSDLRYATDLDNETESGLVQATSATLNAPTASNYVVAIEARAAGRVVQRAVLLDSSPVLRHYERIRHGTGWSPWVEMETTAGAQTKANTAEANAKAYAQNAVVTTGSTSDPNTTTESLIVSNHANTPLPGSSTYVYITTLFYSTKTGNRAQIATSYSSTTPRMWIRLCFQGNWRAWEEVVTSAAPVWQTPVLQNGWAAGFSDRPPRYAVVGNMLYLKGTLKGSNFGDSYPAFHLPAGYRPSEYRSTSVATLGSGASANVANRLGVTPAGGIIIAWSQGVEAISIDAAIPL